jgi:signal transduction histidine kinase
MNPTSQRSSGIRFLENLAYLVPGYQGYKQLGLRQEEDARLRARVHRRLIQVLQVLEEVRARWLGDPRDGQLTLLEQRRLRVQTIADSVRYSPYGFRGFFSLEPVPEPTLEKLLEADLLILEDLDGLQGHLEQNADAVTPAPRTARAFFRVVDENLGRLERHLIMREKVLASV